MGINDTKNRGVKSDETLFSIIEQIRQSDGSRVTDLANDLGISKSAVHKHLVTLEEHGFVVKRGDDYEIGLKFLDYGIYARNRREIHRKSLPKLEKLADETGERASLFVEENGLGVFLAEAFGEHHVNTDARIGARMPLHYTSGGKAILAHMPREQVRLVIDRHGLPKKTENTITDEAALFEELEEIRDRGFAINQKESIKGVHAVGAPILDNVGNVLAAVSVAGAAFRMPLEQCVGEIGDEVRATANEIELDFIYSGGT